jgi:hypothetical protein
MTLCDGLSPKANGELAGVKEMACADSVIAAAKIEFKSTFFILLFLLKFNQ